MDSDLFDFINDLDDIEDVDFRNNVIFFPRPKIYRERPEYFVKYDDIDFFRRYRLSKETVIYLLEKIDHILEFPHDRNKSVSPINQLLITLRFYATGSHLLSVADIGGVSVATSSRIVKRVSEAIVTLRREFIKFPETEFERLQVKRDFFRIARFPNVIGCIDCTHIRIQSPGGDDAELFRNRKSYMSLNVQTVATSNLMITDVVTRWPGSTHDAAIYQNSNLYARFERGDYGDEYLLGDSGYPLKSHLLTPYLNPVTQGQQKYNEAHIKTRNVVERQYGVLKRRFPVLAIGIRLKLQTATNVIMTCCILHNICIIRREEEAPMDSNIINLEQLIQSGQINMLVPPSLSDQGYGFRRNQITNYFENIII